MACSYLNFSSHTENTSKQQKLVAFCEELLSDNDFEAVLVNFCCYEYITVPMNASAAVQKRRLAQAKDTTGVMSTH